MLPILREIKQNTKKYVVRFGELNLSENYQDGDFSNTSNVSSHLFPCLTQRYKRNIDGVYEEPQAVYSKDGLLVIHNKKVMYKAKDEAEFTEVGTVTEGEKQIATVGKYIIIYPDKVYYDTIDKILGNMKEQWGSYNLHVYSDSVSFSGSYTPDNAPLFPFKKGDGIKVIIPSLGDGYEKTLIVRSVSDDGKYIGFDDGVFPVRSDYEVLRVEMIREMPDLEYICESNMRLWGVKDNAIYASKYNDPFNFEVFENLASDSYHIDVGTEGEFTGCIAYSNYICFFKENLIHKLYGTEPSDFRVITSPVPGVQSGSEKSIKNVNGTLFYKGLNGVYAYGGGTPELISSNFGTKRFTDAVAESDGERYYVSMKEGEKWGLYVFDLATKTWLREDETHALDMAVCDNKVHILTDDGELSIVDRGSIDEASEWSVTFCPFNETINEKKVYSKFHLRLDLGEKAWLCVEIKRDTDTKWQTVFTTHNERERTVSIPVMPTRCDSVEIRLSGKGKCILKTFIREYQTGSDV